MVKFMKAMADANKIKWQVEMLPAGGTDAGAMQKFVPGGSIAGAISVPTRNVHQVIEMAHKDDLDASVALLTACRHERGQMGLVLELRQRMPGRKTRQGIQNGSQAGQSRRQEEKGQIKAPAPTDHSPAGRPGNGGGLPVSGCLQAFRAIRPRRCPVQSRSAAAPCASQT